MSDHSSISPVHLSDSDPNEQVETDYESETYDDKSKDELSNVLRGILEQQMATNEVSKTF